MVLIALLAAALAQAVPAFERYPAPVLRTRRPGAPRITDPLSRRYRTALREAATERADFAGHWVLAQVGCGAGCIRPAAVDRVSGRVVWFPAAISGWPMSVQEPLRYRRESRVLVVEGMLDEGAPSARRAYLFNGIRFAPLRR